MAQMWFAGTWGNRHKEFFGGRWIYIVLGGGMLILILLMKCLFKVNKFGNH
jgi:hypothetical protein